MQPCKIDELQRNLFPARLEITDTVSVRRNGLKRIDNYNK